MVADFITRLSVFYADFSYQLNEKVEPTDKIIINELPKIKKEKLEEAIDTLSDIICKLNIQLK